MPATAKVISAIALVWGLTTELCSTLRSTPGVCVGNTLRKGVYWCVGRGVLGNSKYRVAAELISSLVGGNGACLGSGGRKRVCGHILIKSGEARCI